MKRTLIALATIIALTGAASADYRGHRGHHNRAHHGHQGRGYMAPLVGGLLLGGLGYYGYQQYQRRVQCWDEMVGYDRRGREVWQRYCQ
jgi:hypothetical protein